MLYHCESLRTDTLMYTTTCYITTYWYTDVHDYMWRNHHQEWALDWGIALCTSLLHVFWSCARCQEEWRPMLHDFRSASAVRVQVMCRVSSPPFQSRRRLLMAVWSIFSQRALYDQTSEANWNGFSRTEVDKLCDVSLCLTRADCNRYRGADADTID